MLKFSVVELVDGGGGGGGGGDGEGGDAAVGVGHWVSVEEVVQKAPFEQQQ